MKKAGLFVVFLVTATVVVWVFGRPVYRRHKEARATTRAKAFLVLGDYSNASLSARQALAANPRNLEACQVMAQLAGIARVPQVVDWSRRIAEISPTIDNRLNFAATALIFEPLPCPMAEQTLDDLRLIATNSARYHLVAAELALKLNRIPEAETHFLAAGRIEPTNELPRLNLAVLQLRSTNAACWVEGRATLERLTANTNLSHIALQWLVHDCITRQDFTAAEHFSNQLLAGTQTVLSDRLQHLIILRSAGKPEFNAFLATIKSQALTNAAEAQAVARWMINQGLARDAMDWLNNCPVKLKTEPPVALALIDAYSALNEWGGLQAWLVGQKWGELDFIRLAALSHAEEQLHNETGADAHWRLAVRAAGDRIGALTSLLSMAGAWNQNKTREDLLWQIYDNFPRERWPARELERRFALAGNTRALNRLYSSMAARNPDDFLARNNFAATAMLLQTSLPKANQTAKEIYAAHPTEPVVVSTYAWSLHLQGRTKDALAAMEQLNPGALQMPTLALYYGLLLAADHQSAKAATYLALVNRQTLLPEEVEFLTAAQKQGEEL